MNDRRCPVKLMNGLDSIFKQNDKVQWEENVEAVHAVTKKTTSPILLRLQRAERKMEMTMIIRSPYVYLYRSFALPPVVSRRLCQPQSQSWCKLLHIYMNISTFLRTTTLLFHVIKITQRPHQSSNNTNPHDYSPPTVYNTAEYAYRKMLKAQLKFNFGSTFLLNLKKKTDLKERESLQLKRK